MKFLVACLAVAIFGLSLQAQDSAPAAGGGCGAAMPDTPEVKAAKERILGQLLALVPDVVATYGEQKVIKGEEIRNRLRSSLALDYAPALQAQAPTPAMLENVTYAAQSLASQAIERELMLAAAVQDGFKPESQEGQALDAGNDAPELARARANDAAIQKWMAAKIQPAVATEAKLQQYYDGHRAALETRSIAQILVSPKKDAKTGEVSEAAKSEAKAKAAALLVRIRAGEDFEILAREHSDCPSAKQNGDLGRYTREESPFPPEFNDVAFALKDNEVSALVETHYGYHLIKATNVATTMSEEAREEIAAELVRAAVRAKKRELMQAAKVQFKI